MPPRLARGLEEKAAKEREMDFPTDYDDYVSILAEVRRRGRHLAPTIRDDLPALLGRQAPSGLARAADAALAGRLSRGLGRMMLPVLIDACSRAIEDGTSTMMDRYEVGYSGGAVDWDYREIQVMSEGARDLVAIRRDLSLIVQLLERVEDLLAAQGEISELRP
jgi:hypothetical protein